MSELMITLGNLIAALGNVKSSSATAAHLELLRERIKQIEERAENLEKENARLIEENRQLNQQIAHQAKTDQFTEHSGVLFKRKANGYTKLPYCPKCHSVMHSTLHDSIPFICGNKACGFVAGICPDNIPEILNTLNSE